MAPVSLPTLTWEFSGLTAFTANDPVAGMAALAAQVTASSDWRVIAGGDGVTDDYIEIGGEAAGPNPNMRVLVGGNINGTSVNGPDLANRGYEQGADLSNDRWWVGYAPDDGRAAVPWRNAGALYTNRWTGMMAFQDANFKSVKMWSCEEILIVMFGYQNVYGYEEFAGFMVGSTLIAPSDDNAEADERVRALHVQYSPLAAAGSGLTSFWFSTASPFGLSTVATNSNSKAVAFDPVAPTTLLPITQLMNIFFTTTTTTNKTRNGEEIHEPPTFYSKDGGIVPGANASAPSAEYNTPSATYVIGAWRQMRMGPARASDLVIYDPPPPINDVSHTLSRIPTATFDCIYLDNG